MKKLLLFSFLMIQLCAISQDLWYPMGPNDFGATASFATAQNGMAIDSNHIPYILFTNSTGAEKPTVKKLVDNNWVVVGAEAFSAGDTRFCSIAIGSDDIPYVCYEDAYNGIYKATVKKFDGSAWVTVGTEQFSESVASYTRMAVDYTNTPYIAYNEDDDNGRLTVKKFDGTSWVTVGTRAFSVSNAFYASIDFDSNNLPYVCYAAGGSVNKITVKKFDGTNWVTVGTANFSPEYALDPAIAIDNNDVPYVIYGDDSISGKAVVKKFNGTAWTLVGPQGFSPGRADDNKILFDSSNSPIVVYVNDFYNRRVSAQKYNGTAWTNIGGNTFSAGTVSGTISMSFAIDNANSLYVAYNNNLNFVKRPVVEKHNGVNWTVLGPQGLSDGTASFSRIACGADHIPYMVYKDALASNKASVKFFNGTDWQFLGTRGFTAGSADYTDVALSNFSQPTPYVVYEDGSNDGKASVMNYTGSSWSVVGAPGISPGTADYTSIAVDAASGMPFIAYMDGENEGKVTVKKFSGVNWVPVGVAGFSTGTAEFIDIGISLSIPYVAYRDSGHKVTVKKLNMGAWETVGTEGFSVGQVEYVSLAFDQNNIPYVAYKDNANSGYATVMKFNGTSWISVGTAASAGSVDYVSLAINLASVPYILFRDATSDNKASVRKFDGTDWIAVGSAGFTSEEITDATLAFGQNGVPLAGYVSTGVYAKFFGSQNALGTEVNLFNDQKTIVYPNPATNILTISTPAQITNLVVTDLSGKIIMKQKGSSENLNVESLQKGMYFLNVHSDLGNTVIRFIKE